MAELLLDKIYSERDENNPGKLRPDEEYFLPVRDGRKGAKKPNVVRAIGIKFKASTANATLKRMTKKRYTGTAAKRTERTCFWILCKTNVCVALSLFLEQLKVGIQER